MQFLKKILPIILVIALCLMGCSKQDGSNKENNPNNNQTNISTDVSFAQNDDEMFTDRDKKDGYKASEAVKIELKGSTATASSDSVKISGSTVKITEEATYVVSGTLDDGMLVVDAPDSAKLQIVLNGVNITSKTSAALYIIEADKVFVTLAKDRENVLANGGSFVAIDDNNIDGAVFSKQDLTFNGSGALTVTSPAGHGIVGKDDVVFTGGTYEIQSASHAIDANDSVRAINASITADAGKDGIHAENTDDASLGFVYISSGTYTFKAEGDGISAGSHMQICGGTFDITAGGGSVNGAQHNSGNYGDFMGGRPGGMGGERPQKPQRPEGVEGPGTRTLEQTSVETESTSMKGLKSASDMLLSGGNFKINSADDAVHSNTSMYIKKAEMDIETGDDGVHAEETLEIYDGTIQISESYEGIEALHIKILGAEITLTAGDDGLNAAGGNDQSGLGGRDNPNFGAENPNGGEKPNGVDNSNVDGNKPNMGGNKGARPGGMGGGMSAGNGSIVIAGGTLKITASGDGIDANGTLEITGGNITVCGPTKGDTATLDYDKIATISGGTFIGTGAQGMGQTFSDSKQGVITLNVGMVSANTEIVVKDASGKTLLQHTPALDYALVILSSPDIEKGQEYTVVVGSESKEKQYAK